MILPGKTIGVLGGGQLGRMLAQAATRMGYRVHVFEPQPHCPAGAVAHREVNAAYEDVAALSAFARECDVVTYEFENVPAGPLKQIAELTQLLPHWSVLETAQNRSREKRWLREQGIPHAPFVEVPPGGDLVGAIKSIGVPCVAKTASFGYDGKGQVKVRTETDVMSAQVMFRGLPAVVEQFIPFACEVSAVVARSADGEIRVFPVAENIHTNHILDFSIVPARVPAEVIARTEVLARRIATAIGLVGVMGVECFVKQDGEVLVNELAPRTHNSGHYTMDACATSQFEQQVRAICGLPLGDPTLISPAVMVNILGDAWESGEPKWDQLLAEPSARLHLYGKAEARPGRKMGHFTVLARDAETALAKARELKERL
ncbi:MAG TPA: 5-(carboxyamino)imidazole ribonucleotide synthase [Opitutaceae bacterium]|nr:5-(carboxyamino)imidazole ribonucleotide synthase [Opitutaceae bacterium]HND62218.1 5-(carboxyamino)imidazole ribonucleotide synthase [Opitutaceae bacterium]